MVYYKEKIAKNIKKYSKITHVTLFTKEIKMYLA